MKIDTINRWIQLVLESSGVNIHEIANRNLNAATISATKKNGISVSGWSNAVPIDKYEKPISNETAFKKLIIEHRDALSKLLKCEGGAGAEGAILPYVGHLQLISTLKIGDDCCQLCQYKLTKPNLT